MRRDLFYSSSVSDGRDKRGEGGRQGLTEAGPATRKRADLRGRGKLIHSPKCIDHEVRS